MRYWLVLIGLVTSCTKSSQVPLNAAAEAPAAPNEPAATSPVVAVAVVKPPRYPEAAQVLVEQGRAAIREQGEDGAKPAQELFKQALEKDAECQDALWELGWAYQLTSEFDLAVQNWDALRALNPAYPELARHYPVLLVRRDQARLLASLPDPGVLPPPEEEPREGPTLSLAAVGDIQMGKAWPEAEAQLPPDNGEALFVNVLEYLQKPELTFGNVETVLGDEGESQKCGKKSKVCYAFRAPAGFAHTLKKTGFDFVSAANNHAGDFGPEGRVATIAALDAAGIKHSGPVGDFASFEHNGLRVALVAFATGADMLRVPDIETARKVIADVDTKHDLVFVSFHAGAEGTKAVHVPKKTEIFYGEDRGDVHAFAHAMVDAGADLVLGHGPHVLRAMEIYRGRLVAYSLGNFCAWHGFNLSGPLGITTILNLTLATNGVLLRAGLVPLVIDQPGVPRVDPDKKAIQIINQLSKEDMGAVVFDANGLYERKAMPLVEAGGS